MTEPRRFGLVDLLLLFVVLMAAAGARTWYLWTQADNGRNSGNVQVQDDPGDEPTDLAEQLADSNSFRGRAPLSSEVKETAHTAPGYPFLLSLVWRGLKKDDGERDERWADAERAVRWLQAFLGMLTAGCYFLFARRAFHSRFVATLAGFLCALHPFWLINTAEINDGVLATFLLSFCLFLGVRGGQSGGPLASLLYGALLASLSLVRAALLPFSFVAVLWFLWRSRTVKGGWINGFLAFLGFIMALTPWVIRNYQRVGDVVPVVDSVWLHLWIGNNPLATGGPQTEEEMRVALAMSKREEEEPDVRAGVLDLQATRSREELKDNSYWKELVKEGGAIKASRRKLAQSVRQEIRARPVETLERRLQAGPDFFFGSEWFREHKLWRGSPGRDGQAALLGTMLGMLLLGALGWRWTYAWRREALPASLAVMWIPLPYLLSHAEALNGPRLPLDGVLLCYAAFTFSCLATPFSRSLLRGPQPTPAR